MSIEELYREFWDKTSIQQQEQLKQLIGVEIDAIASIDDIKDDRILLNEMKLKYDSDSYIGSLIKPKYNKEKFGKDLLDYQNGDDVRIRVKLVGGNIDKDGYARFEFELVSISKTGTTYKSRDEEYHKKGACFIATACYGNYSAPEVLVLREYRDKVLLQTYLGKLFVSLYYLVSPFLATIIAKSNRLQKFVKTYLLQPIVRRIQQKLLQR